MSWIRRSRRSPEWVCSPPPRWAVGALIRAVARVALAEPMHRPGAGLPDRGQDADPSRSPSLGVGDRGVLLVTQRSTPAPAGPLLLVLAAVVSVPFGGAVAATRAVALETEHAQLLGLADELLFKFFARQAEGDVHERTVDFVDNRAFVEFGIRVKQIVQDGSLFLSLDTPNPQ